MSWIRRVVLGVEAMLLFAVLALVGCAWWLLDTEEGLNWAIARVPSSSEARLAIEGAHGTMARQVDVDRVVFEGPDLRIEAHGVRVRANVFALLAARVSISELHAASIAVELSGEDKPPSLPKRLALPVSVRIGQALVDELDVSNKGQHFQFRDIALAYEGGPLGHRIPELSALSPWGEVALNGDISTSAPFALAGAAAFSRPDPMYAVGAGAELKGNLEHLRASVTGSMAGVPARAELSIAPFSDVRLESVDAFVESIDLARFQAVLPRTAISVSIKARGESGNRFSGMLLARNERSGPLDHQQLPVASASARFSMETTGDLPRARLAALLVTLNGGAVLEGSAELSRERASLDLKANGLDLRSIQSTLRQTQLDGPLKLDWTVRRQTLQASLEQNGMSIGVDAAREGDNIQFRSLRAEANGGKATGSGRLRLAGAMPFRANLAFSGLDPSRFGDYPEGLLNGTARGEGELRPRRVQAQWFIDKSSLLGRPFASQGSALVQGERAQRVDARMTLGGNDVGARGAFGRSGDELLLTLDARHLSELREGFAGSVRAQGRLTGDWNNPSLSLNAQAEALRVPQEISVGALQVKAKLGRSVKAPFDIQLAARSLNVRGVAFGSAAVHTSGTIGAHEAGISVAGAGFDADAEVHGGWSEARGWSGQIAKLRNRGTYPLALSAPAPLEVSPDRARLGRFEATLGEGRLLVREVDWEPGRLSSSGEFKALPAQWILFGAGLAGRFESSLLLDGQWSLRTRERLDGTLSVQRAGGDLSLPGSPPIAFGLQRLAVEGRFDDGRLRAHVDAVSRLGTLAGQGEISPAPGAAGIGYGGASPLSFQANFDLADVRPIARLFVSQAVIGGSVNAALAGSGTLAQPKLSGALSADAVSLDMPPYGVYLRGGRLRARLEGETLQVSELRLQGGDGQISATGALPLRLSESGASLAWEAHDFRVLERPDMRLAVSGNGVAKVRAEKAGAQKFELTGKLRADQGRFDMGEERMPELGDDVVVLGRPRPAEKQAMKVPVALDMNLDLGNQLTVHGRGFDGRIGGQLHVVTNENGEPLAYGKLNAVNATFEAYGQRLQVDPGTLVFDGPIGNPALQVTAWRRNQAVEAGVQLSGTARNPQVQLVSKPAVPEGDKLSWLVLGRAPSDASRGDLGLLQTAAAALLARGNSVPATTRIARAFGFDELALRGGGELSTRVVALGKRLSDRLYITYEQGLGTVASNLIKLDYSLTQRLSVRAETGTASALGLFYRYSWD